MADGLVLVTAAQCLALGAPFGESKLLEFVLGDPESARDGFRLLLGLRLLRRRSQLIVGVLSDDFTRVPWPHLDKVKGFPGDFDSVWARVNCPCSDHTTVVESDNMLP